MKFFSALVLLAAFAFLCAAWCEDLDHDQAGAVSGCCKDQWGEHCDSCSTDLNGKAVVKEYYCANGAPGECFAFQVSCGPGKTCVGGACAVVPEDAPTTTAVPTYSAAASAAAPTAQPTQYPLFNEQPTATPEPAPRQQPPDALKLGGVLALALLAAVWFMARRKPHK